MLGNKKARLSNVLLTMLQKMDVKTERFVDSLPAHLHRPTEFLEFVIPTIVSVAATYFFFTQVMRFATWPRRLEFGLGAAFMLWVYASLLLAGDPFGVRDWILY